MIKSVAVRGNEEAKVVSISNACEVEVIEELSLGTLYHLKYTYPVIDAVGYLKVDECPSLVFVQVLLTPYTTIQRKSRI